MSGTGPTAFGLFEREEEAREAYERLKETNCETFFTRTV